MLAQAMESITRANTTVITTGTAIAMEITAITITTAEMAIDTDSLVKGIVLDRAHHPLCPPTTGTNPSSSELTFQGTGLRPHTPYLHASARENVLPLWIAVHVLTQ